jgi:hypothetical protein
VIVLLGSERLAEGPVHVMGLVLSGESLCEFEAGGGEERGGLWNAARRSMWLILYSTEL